MSRLEFLYHATFPPPDLVSDAKAHRFFLKVGHVRAPCEQYHMWEKYSRFSEGMPVFWEQAFDRLAFVEDGKQSRLCPVLHHVVSLTHEKRRPRLLSNDEASERFHHCSLAASCRRAKEDLRGLVIARR